MKTASYVPYFKRFQALAMAWDISKQDFSSLRALAENDPNKNKRGSWGFYASKMLAWIDSGFTLPLPFKIFAKGNSKLPFFAFSSLPIVNCPGAGECQKFCYSLNAWQYPVAYFRQVMNTLLLSNDAGKAIITKAFNSLKKGILRLYVDGDFKSVSEVVFWMNLITSRPDIDAYGYSKSWVELIGAQLKGIQWPSNYLLNLSSGSNHPPMIKEIVSKLPIVRGEFIALLVSKIHIHKRSYQGPHKAGFKEYQKEVLARANALGMRVFVCKGKCGSCLPNGEHACGSNKFRNVHIAIGVH